MFFIVVNKNCWVIFIDKIKVRFIVKSREHKPHAGTFNFKYYPHLNTRLNKSSF